jgi:hypothetical protein
LILASLYLLWVVFIWVAADWGKPTGTVLHHFDIDVSEGSKLRVRNGEIERINEESMPYLGYLQLRQLHVAVVDRVLSIALALVALIACTLLARKPETPPSM